MLGSALAVVTDLKMRKVPNWLTLPLMALGLFLAALYGGWSGFLISLACAVGALGLFSLPFGLGWLGGGDVKLLSALGALFGWPGLLWLTLYSALAGGVLAFILVIYRLMRARALWGQLRLWGTSLILWFSQRRTGGQPVPLLPLLPVTKSVLREKYPYALSFAVGALLTICFP